MHLTDSNVELSHQSATVTLSKIKTRPPRRSRLYKKTVLIFLASAFILTSVIMLLTYIVDPLQQFRKATWYDPVFSNQQRYQNPGLAKNYDYETIIIGTSMTENFMPSEIQQAIGGKTLKLSIEGSTAAEHYQIAKLALSTGKVHTVLWGLDFFSLKPGVRDDQGPFPYYLYDYNLWNDYKYLFNETTVEQFFKGLVKRVIGEGPQDLAHLNNWQEDSTFSEQVTIKDYLKAQVEETYFGLNEGTLEENQESFSQSILSLVEQYPDVEFKFYYPPYSILRQAVWKQTNLERFENQLTLKKWMFEKFSAFPNVELYDFQTESEWTFNLDLYKDLSHHSQSVNSQIAVAIGKDDAKYRVTADNLDTFIDELRVQVDEAVIDSDNRLQRFRVRQAEGEKRVPVHFSYKETPGDGELLVPVKELASILGSTIEWNQASQTLVIQKEELELSIIVGNPMATLNGHGLEMTYPAKVRKGATLVPLIWTAKALGEFVDYSSNNQVNDIYFK